MLTSWIKFGFILFLTSQMAIACAPKNKRSKTRAKGIQKVLPIFNNITDEKAGSAESNVSTKESQKLLIEFQSITFDGQNEMPEAKNINVIDITLATDKQITLKRNNEYLKKLSEAEQATSHVFTTDDSKDEVYALVFTDKKETDVNAPTQLLLAKVTGEKSDEKTIAQIYIELNTTGVKFSIEENQPSQGAEAVIALLNNSELFEKLAVKSSVNKDMSEAANNLIRFKNQEASLIWSKDSSNNKSFELIHKKVTISDAILNEALNTIVITAVDDSKLTFKFKDITGANNEKPNTEPQGTTGQPKDSTGQPKGQTQPVESAPATAVDQNQSLTPPTDKAPKTPDGNPAEDVETEDADIEDNSASDNVTEEASEITGGIQTISL